MPEQGFFCANCGAWIYPNMVHNCRFTSAPVFTFGPPMIDTARLEKLLEEILQEVKKLRATP